MLQNTTITGRVNVDYQIMTDNYDLYEVAGTSIGDELVKLVDKKVNVNGTIRGEIIRVINVASYQVIE
jgi:hypothetical protein